LFSGALDICINPENGWLNSRIKYIAAEAEIAKMRWNWEHLDALGGLRLLHQRKVRPN
jgi:hypothetical protein